jgi:hypothetical protein
MKMDTDSMTNDGFKNEKIIANYLNMKKYRNINKNMQKLLMLMFNNINDNDIVYSNKINGREKSDIFIKTEDETHFVSVKKGSGNSIHQEKVDVFIKYLEDTWNIDENIAKDIKFFIWGDGTFDGSGEVKNRLSANQIKKEYPEIIENINSFFNEHKQDLIHRFLVEGTESSIAPDYIYYGTYEDGVGASMENIINWLLKQPNKSSIGISNLTFQAWNRNINGGDKSEKKRGEIQLKWSSIEKDLKKVSENTHG